MVRAESPTFAEILSSHGHLGFLHETLKNGPRTMLIVRLYPRIESRTPGNQQN